MRMEHVLKRMGWNGIRWNDVFIGVVSMLFSKDSLHVNALSAKGASARAVK